MALEYVLGRGLVSIDGDLVGNCPEFTFSQEVSTKPRKRVVNGVRYLASSYKTDLQGRLKFTLDMWTDGVVALAQSGKDDAAVVITQTNEVGPKRVWTFSSVNILPALTMPLIFDSWATLEFEADVLFDASGVGMTYTDAP